jgi:hypothetical protein
MLNDRGIGLDLLNYSYGSSTTGEAPKWADRFAAESSHRRSNGCSVALT